MKYSFLIFNNNTTCASCPSLPPMEFDLPQRFLHLWNSEYRGRIINTSAAPSVYLRIKGGYLTHSWSFRNGHEIRFAPLKKIFGWSIRVFQTQSTELAGKPWNSIRPLFGRVPSGHPTGIVKRLFVAPVVIRICNAILAFNVRKGVERNHRHPPGSAIAR